MKIDYVIPMVFDRDVKWQDSFLRKFWRDYVRQDILTGRWCSMGTEELLVKCIRTFLPFVDTIYILLARESQKQPWMDADGIRVVYHKDFIPNQFLPTFNSRTIEMFLGKIPELSEHFIYGHDDMFPVSPMKEEDFFVDGLPCQHVERKDNDSSVAAHICINGMQMVAREFGMDENNLSWLYAGRGVTPLLRSVCDTVYNLHHEDIQQSITHEKNLKNYDRHIYIYRQCYAGLYADKMIATAYAGGYDPLENIEKAIREAVGMVYICKPANMSGFEEFTALVSAAIEKRLQSYLETTNYGERTESGTAGPGSADDASVDNEQRPGGGDNSENKEKVQDPVAEKRPARKTDPSASAQEGRGKGNGKNNRKRGFRFNS